MEVFDRHGRPVRLGPRLGQGGEGAVYEVVDRPGLVAKWYHWPAPPVQAEKLATMLRLPGEPLRRVAAWPIDTLHPQSGGACQGLLLPRVAGHQPIHLLYGPRSRLAAFPRADWELLVRVAANLAQAFAVVHAAGQVIGDVNQGNVLVGPNGEVKLIDCDSFQIVAGGRRFPCDVGVSTFQPPELQKLPSLRGVVRTANHDDFGLAVLIFQLLLLGRHPFAGAYSGGEDMPIERAIRELRFAYGRRAAANGMRPPPLSPPLDIVSPPLAELFERAFGPDGPFGHRPGAANWTRALDGLLGAIVPCARNGGHAYHRRLAACPWCELERRARTTLFPVREAPPADAPVLDLASIWAAIEAVPAPAAAPSLPHRPTLPLVEPSAEARRAARLRRQLAFAFAAFGLAALALALNGAAPVGLAPVGAFLSGLCWILRLRLVERFRRARSKARQDWYELAARWSRDTGDVAFRKKRLGLEQARRAYLELPGLSQRRVAELHRHRRERQLRLFLDRYPLAGAGIKGVGPDRQAMLASFGLETAADVTEAAIRAIPGFGERLTRLLLDWRRQLETGFVFEPAAKLDPADLAEIEREVRRRRARLVAALRQGPTELRHLADRAERARRTLQPQLAHARQSLARAEADAAIFDGPLKGGWQGLAVWGRSGLNGIRSRDVALSALKGRSRDGR